MSNYDNESGIFNSSEEAVGSEHETKKPVELSLVVPSEYRISLQQKRFPLISRIQLTSHSLESPKLTIVAEFSLPNFSPHVWQLDKDEFSNHNTLELDIPNFELLDSASIDLDEEQIIQVDVTVISNNEQLTKKTSSLKLIPPIELTLSVASVYSVVFQQNQWPLISLLELTNNSPENLGLTKVVAEFDPPDFEATTWMIDELASEQTVRLKERQLKFSACALEGLTEKRLIRLKLSVYTRDLLVSSRETELQLLPKNHWGGELHMPELLSAFVTPNTNYCDHLIKKASNLLAKNGHDSKLDGYQSGTRDKPYLIAASLWSVICNEGISYCVPPANFASTGQRIRLADDISDSLLATCLDTALLFASCLEQAGLNSVIALTKEHAMVGVWLVDETFPLLTNNDPVNLRNRIALKDLILFETTLVTSNSPIKFAQAILEADRKISERVEEEFVYVLDIKQARSRKIFPISFSNNSQSSIQTEGIEKTEVELPPLPPLPPVKTDDLPADNLSPSGRIEQWKRKLLDLSKRNKLLNIKQRSMGFQILCSDLDLLEDALADGKKFRVISSSEGPLADTERDSSSFTTQTGDDLETEFIRDQLNRGNLVASCSQKDLEKSLINLFRRAKVDMEEGGTNTLFLAIGMLKWKEDSSSEQSYRAPLILLPVKLERTSARAKPKLMQLPDEESVFNLTLIELLQQDFEIDLSIFQSELPKDASGIDVKLIWDTVRSKIKDTSGFEVVEDVVLSNFSFSKYLMWKDLSDRVEDLKTSALVDHLIEKPAEPYPFTSDFVDVTEVDNKIDPTQVFAPLNADSSQMAAIDASAKRTDFVLEGPPGTGKSETIANIVAHNIAVGRKILFVSEKMAALDAVYSRLKHIGLGHLCLELHSNKASKKGVIDQLNEAWQLRESADQSHWQERASGLIKLRRELSHYVEELHAKSAFGYSARDVISRSVHYRPTIRFDLGWPQSIETAPIRSANDIKNLEKVANDLGLAFKEKGDIDASIFSIVRESNWSNVWQANLIKEANSLNESIDALKRTYAQFRACLTSEVAGRSSLNDIASWLEVAEVCVKCAEQSYDFALVDNSKELIEGLDHLAVLKGKYDSLLDSVGHEVTPVAIIDLPVKQWIRKREELNLPGHIVDNFLFEETIIQLLESACLPVQVDQSSAHLSRIDQIDRECDKLREQFKCTLPPHEIVCLPLTEWIDRSEESSSSPSRRFSAMKKLLKELRDSGFDPGDYHNIERRSSLKEMLLQFNELDTSCNCTLDLEEIVNLPVADWIRMRNELGEKNTPSGYFARNKIRKQMKLAGLKKAKDLAILDSYENLIELIIQMQSEAIKHVLDSCKQLIQQSALRQSLCVERSITFYEQLRVTTVELNELMTKYKGDGVLDNWSSTPEQILKRQNDGSLIRKALYSVASQLVKPQELILNARGKFVDGREFLESSELLRKAEELIECYGNLLSQLDNFSKLSGDSDYTNNDFDTIQESLNGIQSSANNLNAWCHWVEAKNKAISAGLNELVIGLENGLVEWDSTKEQTISAICIWLAPLLIDQSEVLRQFSAVRHDNLIEQFRALDLKVAETTGQYIAARLASNMPDTSGPNAPHEYGVLSRELQKKTRHKPVRQLVQELGEYLLHLTPCFMMSPLSVAQFLPSNYKAFDLVVFDEASQITVWDAVGAIARGQNVIVVGDPKQMPPTNFFNRSQEVDDSDEADLESILDQAMAARVHTHRLTGHYRSKHESLIAFSNYQYYQNSLVTYPSAETRDSVVTLHRVNGVYARGKGRNNPIEARAVVAEVVRRLRDPELQKLSIGIVALNTEHQQLIEDMLDNERRNDPGLERFFREDIKEPLFVKNLETVQGDQRDVICLSIGYGPTEPEAPTMSMNFGPLNKQGGERRLNVAITRASTEMLIFASFDASMIDLSRTSSEAVRHLKAYIDYANRGPVAIAQAIKDFGNVDNFDSDFEQDVALKLRAKGWEVRTQIGVSKFRIDLGIVNPDVGGAYLAGVECDGATYHSSPSARDRDRVRHVILENLGWKLIRIWSTDYFIDTDKVISNVHRKLEELIEKDRAKRERTKQEKDGQEPVEQDEATANHETLHSQSVLPFKAAAQMHNYVPNIKIDAATDLHEIEPVITEDKDQVQISIAEKFSNLEAKKFFETRQLVTIDEVAKHVMEIKRTITLKELAQDITRAYGLRKTSKKQIQHVLRSIKYWAIVKSHGASLPKSVWINNDEIRDVIPFRGLRAWGVTRSWTTIQVEERRGVAHQSIRDFPHDPVDGLFAIFQLKKRHEKTSREFQSWIDDAAKY